MCLLAALGLITPRLILILLWLFSPAVVLGPFADLAVPNPIASRGAPILMASNLPTSERLDISLCVTHLCGDLRPENRSRLRKIVLLIIDIISV